jgi:CheY-like chemotaxis protein
LIVDDHLDTRNLLARLLRMRGHDVVAVGSGSEGLSLMRTLDPDLVILDKCMPEMDGMTVLSRIRADVQSHNVPVIFYTADLNPEDVQEARRRGAQDYLVKGVTPFADVCSTIARYVH